MTCDPARGLKVLSGFKYRGAPWHVPRGLRICFGGTCLGKLQLFITVSEVAREYKRLCKKLSPMKAKTYPT